MNPFLGGWSLKNGFTPSSLLNSTSPSSIALASESYESYPRSLRDSTSIGWFPTFFPLFSSSRLMVSSVGSPQVI